jgi:hypothetical protein
LLTGSWSGTRSAPMRVGRDVEEMADLIDQGLFTLLARRR